MGSKVNDLEINPKVKSTKNYGKITNFEIN